MNPRHLAFTLTLTALLYMGPVGAQIPQPEQASPSLANKSAAQKQDRTERKARRAQARADHPRSPTEWDRNQNTRTAASGTRESRKQASQEARAVVKQQARAGELPQPNDEWNRQQSTPVQAPATHEERKAERKAIRAEVKQENLRGEIPMPSEAGLGYAGER
jgi:hypothetical protein